MKSKLLVSVVLVALPMLVYSQNGLHESCKLETPPVIDGDLRDWQAEWLLDPKGKFIYNICNDDENLYLRIKVTDDLTQRKIGLFGMTVFLNPKGKKIGKMGIKYPVEKTVDELKKETKTGPMDARQLQEIKRNLIRDQDVLEFVGFAKENVVSSRLGLMNGVQVIITSDSIGDYVYEAKFPFKAFHINKAAVPILGVAFVTGKLVPVKGQTGPQQQGIGYGNSNYGRGYNPGYARGMGNGYGGMYNNNNMNNQSYSPQMFTPFSKSTYLAVGIKLK